MTEFRRPFLTLQMTLVSLAEMEMDKSVINTGKTYLLTRVMVQKNVSVLCV